MDLDAVQALTERLRAEIRKAVVGQDAAVDLLLIALLVEGHILLEGVPGTAKTLMVQAFSRALDMAFGRVQFTPDLMPGDVIGTNLFDFRSNQFTLTKGPIFTQLLLADEINRAPPKTQAALLQAMQERAVTIDGQTHALGDGFMVIATQNPIEHQGTYPLPEAQLDRFLFKHVIDYPDRDEERAVVARFGNRTTMPDLDALGLQPVVGLDDLAAVRRTVAGILLSDPVVDYVVDVIRATRETPALSFGASPRAANMIASAARARAALDGRDYVIPDDVKALAVPALRHRIIAAPGSEIEGIGTDRIVADILERVPAPR